MFTRATAGKALLAAALALASAGLSAHPGHVHRIMGTIRAVETTRIVVDTMDEKTHADKTVPVALSEATKYVRGDEPTSRADLKVGERVVVNVGDGATPLKAAEVRVAARKE